MGDIPSTLKYPKIHKVVLKKQKKEKEIKERNKKCLWAMSVVNGWENRWFWGYNLEELKKFVEVREENICCFLIFKPTFLFAGETYLNLKVMPFRTFKKKKVKEREKKKFSKYLLGVITLKWRAHPSYARMWLNIAPPRVEVFCWLAIGPLRMKFLQLITSDIEAYCAIVLKIKIILQIVQRGQNQIESFMSWTIRYFIFYGT